MKVKICGITNIEDALNAVKFGADALGFVFYKKSPRYIKPKIAKEIIKELPVFIERVGLFVNEKADEVDRMCYESQISLAQIHFEASNDFFDNLDTKCIKVIRAKSQSDINKYSNEFRLLDAYVEEYGGAGKRLNLNWFTDVDCSKIVLAGGLNINNLKEIGKFNFYGVDVSSSIELKKGKKDINKMKGFIEKAKNL